MMKCFKNGFEYVEMSKTLRRLMETCSCTERSLLCCHTDTQGDRTVLAFIQNIRLSPTSPEIVAGYNIFYLSATVIAKQKVLEINFS